MLHWQQEHIRKNKVALLQQIKCSLIMLEMHREFDDISFEEFDNLTCMAENVKKVSTLLGFLETRINGYEHLIDSLKATKQTEALKILTNHPNANKLVELQRNENTPGRTELSGTNEAAQRKAGILVGDDGIPIGDIVLHVQDSPVSTEFLNKWRDLARRLSIPDTKREELSKAIESNRKELLDAFEDILTAWRNRQGRQATIGRLIETIKAFGSIEIAESLTTKYLDSE